MILSASLPYPVSVNQMYRAYRSRVIKSPAYRSWLSESVRIARRPLLEQHGLGIQADPPNKTLGFRDRLVAVEILVWPPDKKMRDIDNVVKGILDCVEQAGWVQNDSQVELLMVQRLGIDTHDSRVKITMRPF